MLLRLLLIRDGKLLNLENDAKLPARAAWLTQGDIWWRQDLFFDEVVKDGSERRQYHQWYRFFESQLKKTSLAGNLESHVHSQKGRVPNPDAVQEDMVSSTALARSMLNASFDTRTEAHREWFKTKLCNAMTRVCETIGAQPLVMQLHGGRVPCQWTLESTGLVSGFAAWMMTRVAGYTSRSLRGLWEGMFNKSKQQAVFISPR